MAPILRWHSLPVIGQAVLFAKAEDEATASPKTPKQWHIYDLKNLSKQSLFNLENPNILEFCPHRFSRVKLQRHDPFGERVLGVFVLKVENQRVIQIMLDSITLRDDDHIVPVVEFE